MLNQLSKEVSQVGFVIFSSFCEWLEFCHYIGYLVFAEWHQFVSEKLVNESRKFGAILKTTSVILLNDMHHVNFFIIVRADKQVDDVVFERSLLDLSTFIRI